MPHFPRPVAIVAALLALDACAGPTATGSVVCPCVVLPTAALTVSAATTGTSGQTQLSATVTASGVASYRATLFGTACGTLAANAPGPSFTVTAGGTIANPSAGTCALVVSDAFLRYAGIAVGFSPPRTFLAATSAVPPDTAGTIHLGTSPDSVTASETLVGAPFGGPLTASIAGSCATVAGTNGAFTVSPAVSGTCVLVVADALGQAVPLNLASP